MSSCLLYPFSAGLHCFFANFFLKREIFGRRTLEPTYGAKNFDHMLATVALAGQCTLRQRASLPSASGIYFVTDERNNLLYIGKATNLQSRWAGTGHHRYKQLARKGLDKITLSYVLAPVTELDDLERQYIESLKPLLNNGRVKKYLPKKSPRLSELQRLLKLVSTPLFPSIKSMIDQEGNTVPRPAWDLFRGFVVGIYIASSIPRILIVCQHKIGGILTVSSTHRTKRRFYSEGLKYSKFGGVVYHNGILEPIWKFDARLVVFEFVEFFSLERYLFERFYPYLVECQIAGVKLKKLVDTAYIETILQSLPADKDKSAQDYIRSICTNLQPLSAEFALDERIIW